MLFVCLYNVNWIIRLKKKKVKNEFQRIASIDQIALTKKWKKDDQENIHCLQLILVWMTA